MRLLKVSDPYGRVMKSTKGNQMNKFEIAEAIRKNYIPLAFTCECAGNDPDCASVLADSAAWRQHDTALRIAKFIESLDD